LLVAAIFTTSGLVVIRTQVIGFANHNNLSALLDLALLLSICNVEPYMLVNSTTGLTDLLEKSFFV